ncbi:hypothetical protein C8Q77DRAFT_1155167 [Trametes polyzona]|nr:hypothetical protein C8Q77DRAFT_1155167 [Trametes polyzona]
MLPFPALSAYFQPNLGAGMMLPSQTGPVGAGTVHSADVAQHMFLQYMRLLSSGDPSLHTGIPKNVALTSPMASESMPLVPLAYQGSQPSLAPSVGIEDKPCNQDAYQKVPYWTAAQWREEEKKKAPTPAAAYNGTDPPSMQATSKLPPPTQKRPTTITPPTPSEVPLPSAALRLSPVTKVDVKGKAPWPPKPDSTKLKNLCARMWLQEHIPGTWEEYDAWYKTLKHPQRVKYSRKGAAEPYPVYLIEVSSPKVSTFSLPSKIP